MIYTDIHGRGEPPLPNWDEPRLDEPAHGYLVRLASLNHQKSAKVLAETFGLNGRDLQPKECLDLALSLPAKHKERLIRATPTVTSKSVELMGEVFKSRDWSVSRRFFCPACLAGDGYHRCYWDLAAFRRCPFHEIPIVCEDSAGRPMPWWCPSFSHSPHGNEIIRRGIPKRERLRPSIETYILGRLGIAEPLSVPILDDLKTMGDRLSAMRFIGRVALDGLRSKTSVIESVDNAEDEAVLRVGFSEILKGEVGLRDAFERLANAAPPHGDRRSHSLKSIFGWSYPCATQSFGEFGDRCAQIMLSVAAERGELSVKRYALLDKNARWTTMADIAQEFSVTRACVRQIAEKLSVIDQTGIDRRIVVFDSNEANIVRITIANLVDRDGASALLNISRSFFDGMVRENLIRRFVHIASDRFRPEDILSFAAQIVSPAAKLNALPPTGRLLGQLRCTSRSNPAKIVRAILEGRGQVLGRLSDRFGDVVISGAQAPRQGNDSLYFAQNAPTERPGIPKMDAATIFGDRYETFVELIKAVNIETTSVSCKRIDPASLAAVCKKYAPARIYASVLGCRLNQVRKRLTTLGVKIVPLSLPSGKSRCVVDRESARRVLNLKQDPDVPVDALAAFTTALCDRVRAETVFKLQSKLVHLSFRTGRGTMTLKVSIDLARSSIRVGICYTATRYFSTIQELNKRKASILAAHPGALKWICGEDELTIEDNLNEPALSNPENWSRMIQRVITSMQAFKSLLEPPQRRGKIKASAIERSRVGANTDTLLLSRPHTWA
jgi:hypothetical protein